LAGGAGDEADELSAVLAQNTTKKLKPAGHLKPPQAISSHLRLFWVIKPVKPAGRLVDNSVFKTIQAERQRWRAESRVNKPTAAGLMSRLYDASLTGDIHFYSQDENGMPVDRVLTIVAGKTSFSTLLRQNVLDAQDWADYSRLRNFKKKKNKWPLMQVSHLLSFPQQKDRCIKCGATGMKCACADASWCDDIHTIPTFSLEIQRVPAGYGLFDRSAIPSGNPTW
jgi:hypothetical protein